MAQKLSLSNCDSTLIAINGEDQERGKEFFNHLIKKSFELKYT